LEHPVDICLVCSWFGFRRSTFSSRVDEDSKLNCSHWQTDLNAL